jgi:hypothetical protein
VSQVYTLLIHRIDSPLEVLLLRIWTSDLLTLGHTEPRQARFPPSLLPASMPLPQVVKVRPLPLRASVAQTGRPDLLICMSGRAMHHMGGLSRQMSPFIGQWHDFPITSKTRGGLLYTSKILYTGTVKNRYLCGVSVGQYGTSKILLRVS